MNSIKVGRTGKREVLVYEREIVKLSSEDQEKLDRYKKESGLDKKLTYFWIEINEETVLILDELIG